MEFTGKSIEEAIEIGLSELGLTQDQVEVEILEQASKGFLGINAKKAKVKLTKKITDGERAVKFLQGIIEFLKIPTTTELTEEENGININLTSIKSSSLIGYRGEVLDSLQCLAGAVANTGRDEYRRVVVDCEGYREKRKETLINLAEKLSNKAIKNSSKIDLEPMNPYERRVIHATLAEKEGIKTVSEGKEPNRYISIIADDYKPSSRPQRPYNKDGRKPYNNDGRKPYSNDGRKPYNKDGRKPYNKDGKSKEGSIKRYNKDNRTGSSPRPQKSGYGTFIGNSLKEKE